MRASQNGDATSIAGGCMYFWNFEPTVEELLADPVSHLIMARDGLQAEFIWACVRAAKRRSKALSAAQSPAVESTRLRTAEPGAVVGPAANPVQANERPGPVLRRRSLTR